MRSFIIAILIALMLTLAFALVLNSAQETAEMAFTTESVRLDAASPILSSKEKTDVSDLVSGGFVILGALIAAVFGYVGAVRAANTQVKALKDQSEEDRRRFQQTLHQKKYQMAMTLRREAKRLGGAAEKRIPLAQASRSPTAGPVIRETEPKHPFREQMLISVFPLFGELGDIGLLNDELQNKALNLLSEVDDYNSHIETLPRPHVVTAPPTIMVDQAVEERLIQLLDKAHSLENDLSGFIAKVRAWRCTKCGAFIDEILDTIEDGQRKRCPLCSNTTRTIGLTAVNLESGSSLSVQASRVAAPVPSAPGAGSSGCAGV
jgi:hypothetical protein